MKDVAEVQALTKHFKAVVKACVEGTWQSYGKSTSAVGFKSLPNKAESEKAFKVQEFMNRIDLDYDRRKYFLGRLAGMTCRWLKSTDKDDDLRRDVWGLPPVQWNNADDEPESIAEEERMIREEEEKEIEEQAKMLAEEERESAKDDGEMLFSLREPLLEGDEWVRCEY